MTASRREEAGPVNDPAEYDWATEEVRISLEVRTFVREAFVIHSCSPDLGICTMRAALLGSD
jgi:hypothetical protein